MYPDVSPASPSLLHRFRSELATPGAITGLRAGLIGDDATIAGPFGEKRLV